MRKLSEKLSIALLLTTFMAALFNPIIHAKDTNINIDASIIEHINNLLGADENDTQDVPILQYTKKITQPKKDWTLMIYIAADNDLRNFAIRNLKQMAKVGSNQYINIIVHLDIKISGNKKVTKRYYIQKDKILHLNENDPTTQRMDSGNPKTLISFCKWGAHEFPAKHYGLILWNHGTGPLDPRRGRIIKLSELFTFNPQINKVEVDRSIGFFDLVESNNRSNLDLPCSQMENKISYKEDITKNDLTNDTLTIGTDRRIRFFDLLNPLRGICWDDTTGNYLNSYDLNYALSQIYTNILDKKKFAFIGFDACLMQMTEVANIIKNYADIMIGSQEVILGTGWNYVETLKPFIHKSLTKEEFSKHIVHSYKKAYDRITNDFTLSALKLNEFSLIEENINYVSSLLIECLKKQRNRSVKKTVATCRSRLLCTHFDEPSFIDIHHFYRNLLASLKNFKLHNRQDEARLKSKLTEALKVGCKIIEEITLANVVGKNLPKAKGLSIYFPTNRIYFSYRNLDFCKKNNWIVFLTQYLNV